MNLNKFAREVHANACAHGWWDEERDTAEIIALIHSEWSEALEEYRAGRPMVWYAVNADCQMCGDRPVIYSEICETNNCDAGHKPEGIAVELIDGCIRILDFAAHEKVSLEFREIEPLQPTLPILIADLHYYTSFVLNAIEKSGKIIAPSYISVWLGAAVYEAFRYIRAQWLDPEKIMLEKHEYNKTRPYRHGGKKC